MAKVYTVQRTRDLYDSSITHTGTIEELVKYYANTLECGASYSHEKGNAKINRNPKSIKSLIANLNKAVNNSAANGYAGVTYKEVDMVAV